MSSPKERRILKELNDIRSDQDNSGVFAQPIQENNLLHLKGTFPAPPDTPYAGGQYTVDIKIPDSYPFKSPIIKFDTKIWHPNVSSQTVGLPSPSPPCYHQLTKSLTRAQSASTPSAPAGPLSRRSRRPSSPSACSSSSRTPKTRKTPRSPR